MKKELLIQAKFDTSDFDKSVQTMQAKLKDLYAPADQVRMQTQTSAKLQQMGFGGIMSAPGNEASQRAQVQTKRELDRFIVNEAREQEKLVKLTQERAKALKELEKDHRAMIKGSKEELELQEKISKVKETSRNLESQYKQRDRAIQDALEAKQRNQMDPSRLATAYQHGGLSGLATAGGRMLRQAGPGGIARGAIGAMSPVAGFLGGAGVTAEQFTGYGMRLEAARGSAVQGTAGQDLQAIYSGRSPFEAAYLPERTEAAGLAAQKAGRNKWTDRLKGIGSAGMILGGVGVGAASILGAPVTMGGSTLGLGTAATMIGGGIAGLTNDRTRQSLTGGKEYQQLLAAQQARDFRQVLQDLKEQDPGKKLALEEFQANYQKNVQIQRTLGLSTQGFYGEGGFKQRAAQAGFMPDQAIGMAQSIVGAGGSARMGQQAQFGLQMQRAGLTNAGGILGSLSGGIQSPEATKRATISIMAEAFKIGLDDTNFAEENRRFTQAAATVISRSGATNESDQDRISQALGMFLGERTNKGVEAAGNAYERFQERGSQLGGRRGAMRFAAARQDVNLGKLSTSDLTELLGMRPEDLRQDSAAARAFARDAGFKDVQGGATAVEQLQDKLKNVNKSSRFLIPSNAKKAREYSSVVEEYLKKTGLSYSDLAEKSRKGELPSDVDYAYGKEQILSNKEESSRLTVSGAEAAVGEFHEDARVSARDTGKKAAQAKLEAVGGKVEDIFTAEGAKGAEEARKNFVALLPALQNIGKAADDLVKQLAPVAPALSATAAQRQSEMPKGRPYGSDIYGPILQPQANKPKGQ